MQQREGEQQALSQVESRHGRPAVAAETMKQSVCHGGYWAGHARREDGSEMAFTMVQPRYEQCVPEVMTCHLAQTMEQP